MGCRGSTASPLTNEEMLKSSCGCLRTSLKKLSFDNDDDVKKYLPTIPFLYSTRRYAEILRGKLLSLKNFSVIHIMLFFTWANHGDCLCISFRTLKRKALSCVMQTAYVCMNSFLIRFFYGIFTANNVAYALIFT